MTRMRWPRIAICLLVSVFVCALVLGGAVAAAGPKRGGTLVIGKVGEAPNLDPHMTSAVATRRILDLVYSKLVMMDEKMRAIPDLAQSWEIPNNQTYLFHLRKGVKFHNGMPLTSEDVKFSLERIANPTGGSWGMAALNIIDKIETPDKDTVKITLKTPHAGFFAILASDYACIVSKAVTEEHGGNLRDIAVGTGPFKLEKWTPNVRTELVRNENYYLPGLPYLDRITMLNIPDEMSAIAAMRTKRIDLVRLNDARNMKLAQMPGVQVVNTPNLAYIYFGLNFKVAPFNDVRVRRAIALAIDRKAILNAVGMNLGQLLGPLAPGHTQFAIPAASVPYGKPNIKEAKRLLKEAGYPNGFSTEIISPLPSDFANIAGAGVMIQGYLADIGIQAELKQLELATYLNRTDRLKDAPTFMQLNSGRADPDDQLYSVFYSTGTLNRAFLADKEVDRLLDLGRATVNPTERAKVYRSLQLRLAELVPMVWVYSPDQLDAVQKYVKGFVQTPMWTNRYLERVWLDK